MENTKRLCNVCNKTIRPIGNKRKNGNIDKIDWQERQRCLKCHKKHIEIWKINEFIILQNSKYNTNVPLLSYN